VTPTTAGTSPRCSRGEPCSPPRERERPVELTHRFTVPASVSETWAAFNDIESVAGCFPGAVVTGVEGDTFTGTCKVKLGPIALVYSGSGKFLDKDESSHRFVMEAKGKDKRGNGTAGADVTAVLTESGDGGTAVEVVTDLSITGKPAQFGRGVIQDVSDRLLQQFVNCLGERLGGTPPTQEPVGVAAPAAEPGPAPAADDALDLGATVLPVLAKAYWKQALGVLVLLLVVRRLLGRKH
jgi:uncharacterized protein